MSPRRKAVLLAYGTAAVLGGMGGLLVSGLRVNATPSMPLGVWRVAPVLPGELRRGEIVTVCPPDTPAIRQAAARGYIPPGPCQGDREPLVKPIAAVEGDTVRVTPTGISVNGDLLPGSAPLARDSAGRELRPIPPGTYPVPPDQVWLLSGHDPRSFDSRYFGPVPVVNVQAEARPVWVVR